MELDNESAAAWLRDPAPIEAEPFGMSQDFDIVLAGTLDGGLVGHIEFYLLNEVPNPSKKALLLNTIYIQTWGILNSGSADLSTRLVHLLTRTATNPSFASHRDAGRKVLLEAVELAERSLDAELGKWAGQTRKAMDKKGQPKYRRWCERSY